MAMSRPRIIAECCQNHQGDRSVLRDMVYAAAGAGADYAKIQALYSSDLTRRDRFELPGRHGTGRFPHLHRPYLAEVARLRSLDLTPDDEADFVETCEAAGIIPLITVFTRAAVPRLAQLRFPAVKIASYDCASYPLLREAAAHWSELIVSTGAMRRDEVRRAVREVAGTAITLLHCVTLYPTPLMSLQLARMSWLRQLVPQVGFSDHSLVARDGIWASKAALALGADVIERHFTILARDKTKDGPVSINPVELAALREFSELTVDQRRIAMDRERPDWSSWLGSVEREPGPEELSNRDYYGGRVASRVGGRVVFNWEDVGLDIPPVRPAAHTYGEDSENACQD